MIYVKKPDGTIEQYEDDMKRALQIDKELYKQQGNDFGEIYTENSLPDEDKVKLKLLTESELLQKNKDIAIAQLSLKCKEERIKILDDTRIINILSGATAGYPEYLTPANVAKLIETYKQIYHLTSAKILKTTKKAEVDKIMKDLVFPTEQDIITNLSKG